MSAALTTVRSIPQRRAQSSQWTHPGVPPATGLRFGGTPVTVGAAAAKRVMTRCPAAGDGDEHPLPYITDRQSLASAAVLQSR